MKPSRLPSEFDLAVECARALRLAPHADSRQLVSLFLTIVAHPACGQILQTDTRFLFSRYQASRAVLWHLEHRHEEALTFAAVTSALMGAFRDQQGSRLECEGADRLRRIAIRAGVSEGPILEGCVLASVWTKDAAAVVNHAAQLSGRGAAKPHVIRVFEAEARRVRLDLIYGMLKI